MREYGCGMGHDNVEVMMVYECVGLDQQLICRIAFAL